jgi:hypothetical protein
MALFLNTQDFKNHAPEIHRHYDWDVLSKKIDQITLLRIIPFVSQTEYNALETAYLANTTSADQKQLLIFLQPAIAYYTYLHLLSSNRIQLSTMGVQESSSDDGTSTPASYHAIADVKEEIAEMAYTFLDQALAYMEVQKATFSDWAASGSYTQLKAIFTWTTELFNQFVSAGMSRHTFLSVRSQLLQVQENEIKPQLGNALYNDLLTKFKDNSASAIEKEAIAKIQAWQSASAMLKSIPFHRLKFRDGSVYIRSELDGPQRKKSAELDAIKSLKEELTRQALSAQNSLLDFLDTNKDDFPDWSVSDYTLADGEVSRKLLDNSYKRSFRL